MTSKKIGNIGEAQALARLTELGISLYMQFGDNEPADYIIIVDGKPLKVQVKTSTTYDGDKTIFDLVSSTTHRKNGYKHKYTREEVDAFICYDMKTKNIFLIENIGNMTGVIIRYTSTKNNQSRNIKFYKDFVLTKDLLDKVANKISIIYD